jgi:hypothetical protein
MSFTDKYNSLYIFIINKLDYEGMIENITKIINGVEKMSDTIKRNYLKNRLYKFRDYIKEFYKPKSIIQEIFFINDSITTESLIPYYSETLEMFSMNNFIYDYANTFEIEWLKKLLLDREYINILKIKGNDITHFKINSTKRKKCYSNTIKSMDLTKIIKDLIPKDENYLIHGVSVFLKNFVDTKAIAVHTTELTDDEILKICKNASMLKLHTELKQILDYINHSKFNNKIFFGKDIQTCIKNSVLKTLYCSTDIYKRTANIPIHLKNFEIKVIETIEKGDIGDRFICDFSGAIGITHFQFNIENL